MNTALFIEITAVVLSLLYVWLAAKENKWCWLFGGIGSAIYVYINFTSHLYYDTLLQLYYVLVAVYGLLHWNKTNTKSQVEVKPISKQNLVFVLALSAIATYFLGEWSKAHIAQNTSHLDAGVTVFSLVATWLTARKILESWLLWIAIDIAATFMYYLKGLHATTLLYILFTIMAVYGYFKWKKTASTKGENQDLQHASS